MQINKFVRKNIITNFVLLIFFFVSQTCAYAIEDPKDVPNNRFGIHIFDENDLEDAANLINSNDGDWGYVTVVIREDERNHDRWQKAFDKMRRLHLIPIVRLATLQEEDVWKKNRSEEINNWIAFLDSLNWVVKNRYLVIGNEPNHATEWGGQVKPDEYVNYLIEFSKKAKEASEDFFILPAGLDASAPNSNGYMSEITYLQKMLDEQPDLFDHLDGWTSHSYPNPDFSGSENASGRGTVKTWEWELELLKSLGVDKELPVFITETGWAHNGSEQKNGYQTPGKISDNLVNSFNNAWKDDQILAITPFILNYTTDPFSKFSWKKSDGTFYEFYNAVKDLEKKPGQPTQINSWKIISSVTTPEIINKKTSYGLALIRNTGQKIWNKNEIFVQKENGTEYNIYLSFPKEVEPFKTTLAIYSIDRK